MYYHSYNKYLKKRFGEKVRRISLNAGFGCPNRDGSISSKGCVFCNESGFSPWAQKTVPLEEQIKLGLAGGKKQFGTKKFIAYFQNGAGTNADSEDLKKMYSVINDYPEIVGLSISTRPDCVDEEKLDIVGGFLKNYDVWIEYGVQTIHENTLKKMNRGHTFPDSLEAIEMTAARGIKVGVHIILGLIEETSEDMMRTAEEISRIPVSGVKLHVLHVLKNTKLSEMYGKDRVNLLTRTEYVKNVCSFLEKLKKECVILRLVSDAGRDYLVAPEWVTNKQLTIKGIEAEFKRRGTEQGALVNQNTNSIP
ncbi:MAG: TIGR01212 family radical SAM protein [Candidatus Omnitrophica bacterium]|nr:TIGR01212 family radical SAM protein [Candidatus Omnitrophota bacterium]